MDLMLEAADALFALPTQLIVLGVGDPELAEGFRGLQARYPKHFRFENRFDTSLAQRIYAGCDSFLMPSSFEPCGLGQLIALRYGTIPIVRSTGGLADTVREGRNGFVFGPRNPITMVAAVARMQNAYNDEQIWSEIVQTAMHADYGWRRSAEQYLKTYGRAMANRRHCVQEILKAA